MSKPIRKTLRFLFIRISELAHRSGDRLFADADADARRRGWEIKRRYGGLGREYRDPRVAEYARRRAARTAPVEGRRR